jgi:hypothetical protein
MVDGWMGRSSYGYTLVGVVDCMHVSEDSDGGCLLVSLVFGWFRDKLSGGVLGK